jgi:hypothetical protein
MIIRTLAVRFIAEHLNNKSFTQKPNPPLFCCLCYYAVPDEKTGFKKCSKIMCSHWGQNQKQGDGIYLAMIGPNSGKIVDRKYPLAHEMNPKGRCEQNFGLSRWQLLKRIMRPQLHPGPIRY